jgi:hypothetical protein
MIQDLITFASVILAAAIASQAALAAWRRQQRREVYGAFIAATDDALESLDLLLSKHADARLCDLNEWGEFHQARHNFDIAWGQVRLVAPTNIAEHARKTGFALLDFDHNARNLSADQAKALRQENNFLSWDKAESFVTAARRDLKIEPWFMAIWRRSLREGRTTKAIRDELRQAEGVQSIDNLECWRVDRRRGATGVAGLRRPRRRQGDPYLLSLNQFRMPRASLISLDDAPVWPSSSRY